eukprot:2428984-Heterocapsa_arctica.AAC.1
METMLEKMETMLEKKGAMMEDMLEGMKAMATKCDLEPVGLSPPFGPQTLREAFPRRCLVRITDGKSWRYVRTGFGLLSARGTDFEVLGYGHGPLRNHLTI